MSCNLIYKNGKLEEVRADNGSPSILFQRAKQIFGEETAKEIFYVSKSDQFQEVFKATIEVYKQKLLNKFNNLTKEQADRAVSAVEEMQAIKDKAIADGTFMKAPNGQPTNLNEQQWLQVRTKSFKDFFGDWINDPQNASKVVDSQGEPMVVYHSTDASFTEFDKKLIGKNYTPHYGEGFYFANSYRGAMEYGGKIGFYFINIKNLKEYSYAFNYESQEMGLNDVSDLAKKLGFDGMVYGDNYKQYIVFEPNQIKSAEENIGTFSTETNDIRFSAGENQGQRAEREVIDRLKQNGLANNVFEMNTQEINAKLEELGVDAETRKQVIAYHGSPHSFDRFTTEKMGTGEGAQAFGWGLYFTDLESIARNYADVLTNKLNRKPSIETSVELTKDELDNVLNIIESNDYKSKSEVVKHIEDLPISGYQSKTWEVLRKALDKIRNSEFTIVRNTAKNLYKVSLHKGKEVGEYNWLEWDKRPSLDTIEQFIDYVSENIATSKSAKDALQSKKEEVFAGRIKIETGQSFYQGLAKSALQIVGKNTDRDVSLALLESGIDGIKYPAESISRGATSDTARGFNYVVFDENAITIEEQIQFQKTLNSLGINLTVNGFVYKNDVYLNSDQATNETAIHEFSHLYNSWLKQSRPELYNRGIELVQQEIGLRGVNYQMQYPNRNKIIYVSTEKLLERFSKDDPNYDIQNEKNRIGNRLEKAKEFLQKYVADSRYIDPRTGERTNTNVSFETSVVGIYDGKLGFTDGRHRVLAAKELGYKEVAIEIPTDQEDLFNDLLSKPSEIQDIIDYVKTTQPDLKGEALEEEILAELTGRRGVELLEAQKAKKGGIIDWLKDVWNEIGKLLGLSSMTANQVANLTLGQYADAVGVDLLKGNNLKENETKFRDRTRWNPSRGNQTLEGAPIIKGRKNVTGADPELTYWAEEYARRNGIDYKRQSKYVEVDEDRAKRIAQAYEDMKHDPQDPKVKEAYQNLITQTKAQYDVLVEAGYKFYFYDETNDPYSGSPWAAMEDLRNNKTMAVFATEAGYGSSGEDLNVADNPMLQETGLQWSYGSLNGEKKRVLANDLFRAVHDAFGHGLEGAGFRAQGEENAWQAHARLFTGSAVAAITSETRGQNSWLNYGKYGEKNRTASLEETIFADQKTGLMPEWTWNEGFDKGRVEILPENSTNYANLTEDNEGNFVFYHVGNKGYETIKKGTGQNKATSREEASAINRVGGLAMYYPAENVGESMVTGDTKYMVKIPKEKVYDFNSDTLNLLPKAEKLFRESHPNQAFDKNSQLAFTTKVAVEEGFDIVVARWDGTTRVQTVKEFKPVDTQTSDGNTIVKDFKLENKFESNKDKGWRVQLAQTKKEKLKEVYSEIYREVNSRNEYSNPLYRIEDSLEYSFEDRFSPFKSQEEITSLVESSTLPESLKQKYREAIVFEDKKGYSFMDNVQFSKSPKLEIQKQETKRGLSFVPTINGQKAGAIRLSPHKDGYKVDEVVVYDRFQGKGLGTRLYQEVAKDLVPQGKSLYSLNTRTQGADNIWQKFVDLGIAEKTGNDYKLSSLPKTIDKNGEPKLEEVTKFITNQNKTDRKLNTEEKAELLNFMISNGYTNFEDLKTAVKQAFYNDMGMFTINPQKLVSSGLYDKASANSLTDEVQPLIEALLNTDMEVNLSEVDYEKVFDKTLFGNFRNVPRLKENVGNTDVLDENLQPKQNNNTREKLLVASKVVEPTVSLRKIGVIFKTSEAVAKNNIEDVQEVLDEIVKDLAQYGIDLVGLDTTGNYRGFLEVLREFITNPNQENINTFSEAYNERFMQDVSTQKVETPTDKKYFYSETKKSEQEVFEEQSLIKQAPNLYYKVRRESIDSLLNKLNLRSQRAELEKEARTQEGFTNPEIALEVLLYKKAFKTPTVANYATTEQAQVDNFSGNYQYLTTDFVADFQAEMIKEKLKDSKKYKNFYSLFDINEKGLYLKDNDSYSLALVEMYADNNLRQYSLLSKQMPNLKVTETDLIPQQRNNIVNNKQQLKEYKGNAYRIDNNNLIVKGATEKFIKIDNQVFESVQKDGELSLFSKIIEQPSEYYQIVEQPLPNLDIRNYSNLKTTPEKFLKVSSLKSKAEIDKLKNNNFDCL